MNRIAALAFGIVLTASVPLCAQPPHCGPAPRHEQHGKKGGKPFNPEKFRKDFEQYVTRKAGLTAAEAKRFYPLFHELRRQQRDIQQKIRRTMRRMDKEKLSDKDCERILAEVHRLQKMHNELESKYNQRFKKALSARKLLMVMRAEHEFGRDMFRKGPKE